MQRIAFFLAAMLMMSSASARVIEWQRPVGQGKNRIISPNHRTKVNKKTRFDALKTAPAGERRTYERSGRAIYGNDGSIYVGYQTGNMNVVFADDGKVYIQNILYNSGNSLGDYWVEGTISSDGTQIFVPMGQSIYWSDTYQADIVLTWGTTRILDSGRLGIDVDEGVSQVVYTIDGDIIYGPMGVEPVEDPENSYWHYCATGLGTCWTDDGTFGGYLEWESVFTLTEPDPSLAPQVIYDQPEGAEYVFNRSGFCIYNSYYGTGQTSQNGKLKLVINHDTGKCYLQNPLWYNNYDTWVEGTYDAQTGIISIPTGQYIAWNDQDQFGIQLFWGDTYAYNAYDTETGEDDYRLGYAIDNKVTNIFFMFDIESLTLLNSAGDVGAEFPDNYFATGMMGIYSDDGDFTSLDFNTAGEAFYNGPAVPRPVDYLEWYDSGSEDGYSYLSFSLPFCDLNGSVLDEENISYCVYTDGEIFVFDAMTYCNDLAYDMTEIPYSVWSNGWDFYRDKIYFYRTNNGVNGETPLFYENIGIQVYYTAGCYRNPSEIVWLYGGGGGIVNLNENELAKAVTSVRYYNLTGQEIENPSGLTIQLTTYSDGSTTATKVVK